MSLSVDLENRVITASVGDLVGSGGRVIGLGGSGMSRLWIGQELHRRRQAALEAEDPGFRSEVPLEREVEIDGWTLRLTGRADGVLYDNDTPIRVDEIKTLHFAVDLHGLYADERMEPFRDQLKLYAWMLTTGGAAPEARLTLLDIVSSEEKIETVRWAPEVVEAWLRKRIHRLVSAENRRTVRAAALREAADAVRFPHAVLRPGQETITAEVEEVLERGGSLLLQAPTGTGKTAAVLHPAVKVALSRGRRVFFLTAKTLQQRLASETLKTMQADGLFRSLQLRAKSKMCANTEMVCHEAFCPWAKEYALKMLRTGLLPTLLENSAHQDPDVIYEAAYNDEVCPFEVSLELLAEVDVVVCDYNYVFDPTIGLGALLGGEALNDAILIVDEAHNLIDRSREYFSPVLALDEITRAKSFLSTRHHPVFQELEALCSELAALIEETVDGTLGSKKFGDRPADFSNLPLSDLRIAFDSAMLRYFLHKRENELWWADDPAMDVFLSLTRFHRVLELGGDEFVHLVRSDPTDGRSLKIFCTDASRFTGEIFREAAGVVAMSATLEPFEFYRNLLGFDRDTITEVAVPTPFPAENRLILNIPDVDTTWRARSSYHDAVASYITRLAPPERNTLVLFPSYAYLEAVRDRLTPSGHEVIVQRPGSVDAFQGEVLERLGNDRPHLLLAVLGGIFAEGVDYPGEMLSAVFVVSPGLPQFDTERQILKAYYEKAYSHGFSYAYLIPGMTRVIQAAGRLIRSETDRGVIVLIGRRFQDGRHARYLPADWTGGDPSTLLAEDPEFSIRRFFDE